MSYEDTVSTTSKLWYNIWKDKEYNTDPEEFSKPLKFVYRDIRNQFNDSLDRSEFEKRKKDRILDLKKIKYYVSRRDLLNFEYQLKPVTPVLVNQEYCYMYEEWKAWPTIWAAIYNRNPKEIDNPHYIKTGNLENLSYLIIKYNRKLDFGYILMNNLVELNSTGLINCKFAVSKYYALR
jgi:hypothetical protein